MLSPCFCIIIIIILFFPLHSIGQIYKWADEEGIIHFTDDPSKIPEKYISKEGSKQDLTISPLEEGKESKDDLKQPFGQKSNEMTPIQWVGEIYKEKSIRNLVYLIGLLIILLILIKILREPRPAEVLKGPFISTKRPIIFDVYYRNYSTDSMVFLGKIIERRRKERGSNFKDLLFKAKQNYSTRVKDPSTIFLLSS